MELDINRRLDQEINAFEEKWLRKPEHIILSFDAFRGWVKKLNPVPLKPLELWEKMPAGCMYRGIPIIVLNREDTVVLVG